MSESIRKPAYLLADGETTGTSVEDDALLEFGAILLTEDLEVIAEFEAITPYDEPWRGCTVDPYVQVMHQRNGLWEACRDLHSTMERRDEDTSLDDHYAEVDDMLCAFLRENLACNVVLAGNSPHFDRRFIDRHLPDAAKFLHYRHRDISCLIEEFKPLKELGVALPPKPDFPHRALPDCRLELQHWRDIRAALRAALTTPSAVWLEHIRRNWHEEIATMSPEALSAIPYSAADFASFLDACLRDAEAKPGT